MPDPLPGLELVCLGAPAVRVEGGGTKDLLWRRNLGLLIYLALSPDHTRTREHLMGLLWPEKPQDKASHSLNEALRRCRAALGSGRIITEAGRLRLDPTGLVVDVRQLEDVDRQRSADIPDLIRGEFLEGFHIDNAPAFEDWAASERSRLCELSVRLLVDGGTERLAQSDHDGAREFARRALALDPHAETAAGLALRAATLSGDSSAALSLYHEFASRLDDHLGETPGRELQALAQRIRTGTWRKHSSKYRDLDPPLVGRTDLHRSLFRALQLDTPDRAQVVVISGDRGTGRSRLLGECVERLGLDGVFVASIRLLETDHDAPWNTLRAVIHAGLGAAPGVAATEPHALGVLAGTIPELADRATPIESDDDNRVPDAFLSLVTAVVEEQPLAVAIDDVHWADGATVGALRHVWRRARDLPITLLLTVDAGTELPSQLVSLLEQVAREVAVTRVRLLPLSANDVRELVRVMAPWCASEAAADRVARRVALESGGNPFLAVTLLRDLDQAVLLKEDLLTWPPEGSTLDAPLPFSIPSVVRIAVAARMSRLTPDALAVARAASVCGLAIDARLAQHLTGLGQARLDAALDELERERLVAHTGERYVFNGRLMLEVTRSEYLLRGEKHRLRERAVAFLESRSDPESRSLRAELLMAMAERDAAMDSALEVVDEAVQAGAVRTAQRALDVAERAATDAESEPRERLERYRRELEARGRPR